MLAAVPAIPAAEPDLVARLKAGDDDAYAGVLRALGARLLAVARRVLRDEDLARDAVQDALLSAFRAIERFDGDSQLSTWLHRIVVNTALMRLRARKRRPEQPIEPQTPASGEDGRRAVPLLARIESAEEALLRAERRDAVRRAIAGLPEAYRTVLRLRDLEERSTREAAALVGVSDNALKLRLHRARQALATVLREAA